MYVIDHAVAFAIDAPAKASHLQQIDQNIDELDGRFHPTTGHAHNGTDSPLIAGTAYIAGDIVRAQSLAEKSSGSTTYVAAKKIALSRSGTLRIKFRVWVTSGGTAWAKVYRNGVAVSGDYTNNTGTPLQCSVDIAGWAAGDECQLYYKVDVGLTHIDNFQLCVGNEVITLA